MKYRSPCVDSHAAREEGRGKEWENEWKKQLYRITDYLCEHYIYVNMRVKLKSNKYNSHNLYIQRKIIWYK